MAETCVALLKKYGNDTARDRGSLAYGQAKAEYDGVIGGLIVALARKGQPGSLPDLQAQLQRGFELRDALCRSCRQAAARRGRSRTSSREL
jgi:hypothetical protein